MGHFPPVLKTLLAGIRKGIKL